MRKLIFLIIVILVSDSLSAQCSEEIHNSNRTPPGNSFAPGIRFMRNETVRRKSYKATEIIIPFLFFNKGRYQVIRLGAYNSLATGLTISLLQEQEELINQPEADKPIFHFCKETGLYHLKVLVPKGKDACFSVAVGGYHPAGIDSLGVVHEAIDKDWQELQPIVIKYQNSLSVKSDTINKRFVIEGVADEKDKRQLETFFEKIWKIDQELLLKSEAVKEDE